MLSAYARYVSHAVPHPTDPRRKVTSVKIYRVQHNIVLPPELAEGVDPAAAWFYLPFYQGEYTPDGELMDPDSPYLYWMIPIVRKPQIPANAPGAQDLEEEETPLVYNCLVHHARLPRRPAQGKVEPLTPGSGK
jgi:hypothetical protein